MLQQIINIFLESLTLQRYVSVWLTSFWFRQQTSIRRRRTSSKDKSDKKLLLPSKMLDQNLQWLYTTIW